MAAQMIPVIDSKPTPVYLGSEAEDWAIPLIDVDGSPVRCVETIGDTFQATWDCGDATIESSVVTGSKNQDNTFQRYLRANGLEAAQWEYKGNLRSAHNSFNGGAMSLARNIDGVEYTLLVYVSGENFGPLYNLALNELIEENEQTKDIARA
ncbi:hypothetical protein CPPEL_00545 [Corynebacterium pseudopelargi]|uniref:Uncharacterized protein n=1 Tax=Corynebacterium pseudopelargi TaxID=2080757 RepID=A0A3G6IW05_9CORY|nr:hypothetical protein CPPEL_00545 [Corynebacterium pseudopelargi]